MIEWMKWAVNTLKVDTELNALVDGRIYSAISKGSAYASPFLLLTLGPRIGAPAMYDEESGSRGTIQDLTVWCHDEPIGYKRVNEMIELTVKAFHSATMPEPGMIACRWAGDSTQLVDDFLNTFTRNTAFRLTGRESDNG